MKRIALVAVAGLAVVGFTRVAVAQEIDVDVVVEKDAKKQAPHVTRIIVVTSDGKKREIKLRDGKLDPKSAKGLPHGVRIHVERRAKETNNNGRTKRSVTGRAIIVGPDGRKREIKFDGGKVDEKSLKDLPKDIRVRVLDAVKGKDVNARSFGRAIIVGPDGTKREFKFEGKHPPHGAHLKDLPEDVRKKLHELMKNKGGVISVTVSGKGVVIGPDGKKRVFEFKDVKGGGNADIDITLKKLPADVRGTVRQLIVERHKSHAKVKKHGGDKLDLILKRLENLQKQVDELRKRIDKK